MIQIDSLVSVNNWITAGHKLRSAPRIYRHRIIFQACYRSKAPSADSDQQSTPSERTPPAPVAMRHPIHARRFPTIRERSLHSLDFLARPMTSDAMPCFVVPLPSLKNEPRYSLCVRSNQCYRMGALPPVKCTRDPDGPLLLFTQTASALVLSFFQH